MQLEPTEENIAWVYGLFKQIEHLPGFPKHDAGVAAEARAFLRIVGDRREFIVQEYNEQTGEPYTRLVPTISGREIGEKIIQFALDGSTRWPGAFGFRLIMEDQLHFTPADGRNSWEIEIKTGNRGY